MPSFGYEVYDVLVVDDASSFAQLLGGTLPPRAPLMSFVKASPQEREHILDLLSEERWPPAVVPPHVGPACARIIESGAQGDAFFERCEQAAAELAARAGADDLAALARETFAEVYARHRQRCP